MNWYFAARRYKHELDSKPQAERFAGPGCNRDILCTMNIFLRVILFFLFVAPATVLADWRKDIGVFRIGIVTKGDTVGYLAQAEPFRLAMSEALEMDVEYFPARNATILIDAIASERIEYAVFSASAYALAWSICECVEPVVTPRTSDSTDGYHLVAISQPGGPQSLQELPGRKVGILGENSITGDALPKHLFEQEGLDISEIELVGSADAEGTLKRFLDGELDVLVGWSSLTGEPAAGYSRGTLRQLARMQNGDATAFQVIWKSPQLPHRPHAVRKKLDGELKRMLRELLVSMFEQDPIAYDSIEPVYGGGFTVSRHGRFAPLIELVKTWDSEPEEVTKNPPE